MAFVVLLHACILLPTALLIAGDTGTRWVSFHYRAIGLGFIYSNGNIYFVCPKFVSQWTTWLCTYNL